MVPNDISGYPSNSRRYLHGLKNTPVCFQENAKFFKFIRHVSTELQSIEREPHLAVDKASHIFKRLQNSERCRSVVFNRLLSYFRSSHYQLSTQGVCAVSHKILACLLLSTPFCTVEIQYIILEKYAIFTFDLR